MLHNTFKFFVKTHILKNNLDLCSNICKKLSVAKNQLSKEILHKKILKGNQNINKQMAVHSISYNKF
jgi:hypothetical protein